MRATEGEKYWVWKRNEYTLLSLPLTENGHSSRVPIYGSRQWGLSSARGQWGLGLKAPKMFKGPSKHCLTP